MKHHQHSRHGLALRDVAAAIVTLAVLAALLALMQPRQRSLGQLGESMSNLREFGVAFDAYGRDNADLVSAFSWKKGTTPSTYPDLKTATTDVDAAACQAVDIMRRRANLTMSQLPRQNSWIPHVYYSHLVLVDYLGNAAPWNTAISPGDAVQLKWASDPLKWQQNEAPSPRWPFASSYEIPTSLTTGPDSGGDAVSQASTHNTYTTPTGMKSGGRLLSEVTYPANKALMYERFQRFFGPREVFCLFDEARVPVLALDGNVQVRQTKFANAGWQPNNPNSPSPTTMIYSPSTFESQLYANYICEGTMRWTRHGLGGTDFDAAEIP